MNITYDVEVGGPLNMRLCGNHLK